MSRIEYTKMKENSMKEITESLIKDLLDDPIEAVKFVLDAAERYQRALKKVVELSEPDWEVDTQEVIDFKLKVARVIQNEMKPMIEQH